MNCLNCQRKLGFLELIKLAIDGEYRCDSCHLDLVASKKSFFGIVFLVEISIIPIAIIFAFIFFNVWVSLIVFGVVLLLLNGFFNYISIKKQFNNIKHRTPIS